MAVITPGDTRPMRRYVGTGTQKQFAFPFRLLDSNDLVVEVNETVVTSGFTLQTTTNPQGVQVNFTTAPAADASVLLYRRSRIERTSDFLAGAEIRTTSLNQDLDRLTLIAQELDMHYGATLRLKTADDSGPLVLGLPDERRDKFLRFDAEGQPVPMDLSHLEKAEDLLRLRDDAKASSERAEEAAEAAEAAKLVAEAWAEAEEDSEVAPGSYSAYHWAQKAQAAAFDPELYYDKPTSDGRYVHMENLPSYNAGTSFDQFLVISAITNDIRRMSKANALHASASVADTQAWVTGTSNRSWSPVRLHQAIDFARSFVPEVRAHCVWDTSVNPLVIHESLNISSITERSTGRFTLNFAQAFAHENYAATGMSYAISNGITVCLDGLVGPRPSTTSCPIKVVTAAGTYINREYMSFMAVGALA